MSDLQFQEGGARPRLQSFYGRNIDQMPVLLADGRVPMTPRQLLYERVHGGNEHDRGLLCNNYVDTACAVVTGNSGEVLIGLYSDPLVKKLIHSLNPKSRLWGDGSLPVGADAYHEIRKNAFVISHDAVNSLRNSAYHEQGVREGFWNYVAEGDEGLVRDHLRLVQERVGGSMENRMGLWLSSTLGLRLLCAGSVGGCDGDANGYDLHLGNGGGGRLVGVGSAGGAAGTESARERAAQKTGPYRDPSYQQRPSLEEMLAFANGYVPEKYWDDFAAKLEEKYYRRE